MAAADKTDDDGELKNKDALNLQGVKEYEAAAAAQPNPYEGKTLDEMKDLALTQAGDKFASVPVNPYSKLVSPDAAPQQALPPQTQQNLAGLDQQQQQPAEQSNPYYDAINKEQQGDIGALNAEQAANTEIARQQGKLSDDMANIVSQRQQAEDSLMNRFQSTYDQNQNEINHVMNDVRNSHINPDQYMENMSTPQKVRTAIGMLLAGMGSGMLRQENPVMKYLDQQIDRNIDAQKIELANKHNVLGALLHQQGNLPGAANMFRAINISHYQNELQEAAMRSGNPMAIQNAKIVNSQLEMKKNELIKNATIQGLMYKNNNGNVPFSMLPKEMQDRWVPLWGQAAQANPEQVNKFNERVGSGLSAKSTVNRIIQLANTPWAKINPETQNQIKTELMNLKTTLADTKFSRVTENDVKMLDSIISNPATFFGIPSARTAALRQVGTSVDADLNDHAQAIGLPRRNFVRQPTPFGK